MLVIEEEFVLRGNANDYVAHVSNDFLAIAYKFDTRLRFIVNATNGIKVYLHFWWLHPCLNMLMHLRQTTSVVLYYVLLLHVFSNHLCYGVLLLELPLNLVTKGGKFLLSDFSADRFGTYDRGVLTDSAFWRGDQVLHSFIGFWYYSVPG